jgi:ribosome maturation factor RimP
LSEHRPLHAGLEGRIADIVAPRLEAMGYELVRIAVLGRENPTVQIMADRTDGLMLTVEDCEAISHQISAVLDVDDPIAGEWTLEVSSPGIDRPLTRAKDWVRYAGHQVKVEMTIPLPGGRKRLAGIVLGAADGLASLRVESGETMALPMADIRRARLVLTDALIEATQPGPKILPEHNN